MLSGCGRGSHNLEVHVIRRCDIDNLNLRVGNHILPASCVTFETKPLLGFPGPLLNVIRTDHELCLEATIVEAIGSRKIRPAVYCSHPTHPNHTHANDLLQFLNSSMVTMSLADAVSPVNGP
jgi:hypothetical protein